MALGEIYVKDLGMSPLHNSRPILTLPGPQLSWTTVFVIEYLGPILIHLSFLFLRPYIYSNSQPLSASQKLAMAMIVLHFIKREYETLYIHKFSLSTMPFRNIFKNSAHYWLLSGLNIAYWIYAPNSYTARSGQNVDYMNMVGIALYIFGELSNLHTHITLSNLRSPGGTERGIPQGYGFNMVTCPNYMFELIAWTGIALVSKSWAVLIFSVVAWAQMHQWAIKKERALRSEFPDKYKKKKYVLIPGPDAVIKAFTG
jgi:very-long-chain enoyl-CoA reductase